MPAEAPPVDPPKKKKKKDKKAKKEKGAQPWRWTVCTAGPTLIAH
jgi:hypothetical protein